MNRPCDCPHALPLCACGEGLRGQPLIDRSRWLSSLAGWPGRLDPAMVAQHEARMAAQVARLERPEAAAFVSEADLLPIVGSCPHARISGCSCRGIDCSGGKRDGQRVTIEVCRNCLSEPAP